MPPHPTAPTGTCPACDTPDQKLLTTKHLDEGKTAVCKKCHKKAVNLAYREKKRVAPPAKKKRPEPAPAELAPAPKKIVDPGLVNQVPAVVDTGHANGRAIILAITCHEKADIVRVLAATVGLSVHIGLEGVP